MPGSARMGPEVIRRRPEVETPIVASQWVPRWILEFELAQVDESGPPAERIGWNVPNLGKRMQESTRGSRTLARSVRQAPRPPILGPGTRERSSIPPRRRPHLARACPSSRCSRRYRSPGRSTTVNMPPVPDLPVSRYRECASRIWLATLCPAQVLHHLGVGEKPFNDPEIAVRPRRQLDHRLSVCRAPTGSDSTTSQTCGPFPRGMWISGEIVRSLRDVAPYRAVDNLRAPIR